MKISLKWLCDYIDVSDYFAQPQELMSILTSAGLEVEGLENRAKQFENVVVGHILRKGQHPNADRLSLCEVTTGDGVVHQIICGARNHQEGDRVVVALPGANLPGDFLIKRSKIRGVESGGMLCSEKELGLSSESEGIMILPSEAPVGQSFAKFKGLDDILFEIKVTPNRADCLSHFGLARELGCLLGRDVKLPLHELEESTGATKEAIKVELRSPDLCPRYSGRGVSGVRVAPSPDWLRNRLETVGVNSINNIVDITNFVMLELGQPLHAFDVRYLEGQSIVIDKAKEGEAFVTLDGTSLKLDGDELTIRDREKVVALAGIVGGKNSGVRDDTTEIFIESAYFLPAAVRRTSRKFGIETDSSYRFSRGTNPQGLGIALDRAAYLVKSLTGGKILRGFWDEYPQPLIPEPIVISLATLSQRLGFEVLADSFADWMKRLGCDLQQIKGSEVDERSSNPVWSVRPPAFRWDLICDMDLVEEFARLHGYDHIPESQPPLRTMPAVHDKDFMQEVTLRRLLQAEGCLQAINFSFVSRKFQKKFLGDTGLIGGFGLRSSAKPIEVLNPLNEELNVMRTSLLPGLIRNVIHNNHFGNSVGRLHEVGHVFFAQEEAGKEPKYRQECRLGLAVWGTKRDLWCREEASSPLVFELKGILTNILRGLLIGGEKWLQAIEASDVPEFLHPGRAAILEVESKKVGFIGGLHPLVAEDLKIRESCALAEINLEALLGLEAKLEWPRYKALSKFPAVDRDVAFLMPKSLPAETVATEIRQVAGELLKEVQVFDVFEGGQLQADQRSVAFRLVFQSQGETLEDQAINNLRDRVVQVVGDKFGISRR